jgi:hypothetical protein
MRATFECNLQKTSQSKQLPNVRMFAQSGHTGGKCQRRRRQGGPKNIAVFEVRLQPRRIFTFKVSIYCICPSNNVLNCALKL